jgi:adenine-specific DNA-methyltransferase
MKMGRRFITVEQMNYVKDLTVRRLSKVIAGDPHGISQQFNWKGGSSFIYCELAQLNQKIVEAVQKATTDKELERLFSDIQDSPYIDYRVSLNGENTNFTILSIDEKKDLLFSVLDKNQLYKNYSEIEDETLNISNQDKRVNIAFYGGE